MVGVVAWCGRFLCGHLYPAGQPYLLFGRYQRLKPSLQNLDPSEAVKAQERYRTLKGKQLLIG